MSILFRIFRTINILSIDVAVGAVSCALFFTKVFDGQAIPLVMISLGLSVWLIYTLDHLIDARMICGEIQTLRHRFHARHFRKLAGAWIAIGLLNFYLVALLPRDIIVYGCITGIPTALYLLMARSIFMKEMIVGLIYCTGVLLPLGNSISITTSAVWTIIQFLSVVLINLILFAWFDRFKDQVHNTSSIVTTAGAAKTVRMIWILFGINILAVFIAGFATPNLILCVIAVIHMVLMMRCEYFMVNERFRLVGDAVFFMPVFYAIF